MNSHTLEAHTFDISLVGGKFNGRLEISPGRVLAVELIISGRRTPLLIRNTRVQWVTDLTFGGEFEQVETGELDEPELLIKEYDGAEKIGHA